MYVKSLLLVAVYIDPKTKAERRVPLELFYKQDSEPVYGIISDDDGRAVRCGLLTLSFIDELLFLRTCVPDVTYSY